MEKDSFFKLVLIIGVYFLVNNPVFGERYTADFNSDLPLVIINTDGKKIPQSEKMIAEMGIIHNCGSKINSITDSANIFYGFIAIELRGSSSKRFPKKSYSLETLDADQQEMDVSLLGMPADNDWILYAPYSDKTLMRDVIAYRIARDMGRYASRTVYVELILNNDYRGVYILEEKIKAGTARVNIASITKADTAGMALTGGYILKVDRPSEDEKVNSKHKFLRMAGHAVMPGSRHGAAGLVSIHREKAVLKDDYIESAYYPSRASWQRIEFRFHYPEEDKITPHQKSYISNYISDTENAIYNATSSDDYRQWIDVASFIDYFILNEVTHNIDAYRLSTYFFKDRDDLNGKITMGPAWDFNLSMGNVNYCNGHETSGWSYQFNGTCPTHSWLVPFWWEQLLKDPKFVNELKCRWVSLRQNTLNTVSLLQGIDSLANHLESPQERNFKRWPILEKHVWPNKHVMDSFSGEVRFLKEWLTARLEWMDQHMPGTCSGKDSTGNNVNR